MGIRRSDSILMCSRMFSVWPENDTIITTSSWVMVFMALSNSLRAGITWQNLPQACMDLANSCTALR